MTPSNDEFVIEIEAPAIEGAREAFDRALNAVFSNWKARIRGNLDRGRSGEAAEISVEFQKDYPAGSDKVRRFQQTVRLPIRPGEGVAIPLIDRVWFEILIFKAEGRQPGGVSVSDLRSYLGRFGNVAVYDAGFRLPYYGSKRDEVGEDWLSIAADQGRRLNQSELLPERLRTRNKYMQDLPAPGRIFGAVEINTNHERRVVRKARGRARQCLQIQPGRDRLHDNQAFYQLKDLVRFSLDLYANRFRLLSLEVGEKKRPTEPVSKKFERAISVLERNRREMPAAVFNAVKREFVDALKASAAEEEAIDQRAALLAPLASAGMVALALNHEIARESRFLDRIRKRLQELAAKYSISELTEMAKEFGDAKNRVDSLRELFAPLLSDEDKAATDRLLVRVVVDNAVSAMSVLMPGVSFDRSSIPTDLRFPLGSLADWNALLQNILANAWNALLDSRRREVAFRGGRDSSGREWLRVSDTGAGLDVPVGESDKLFEPFERRLKISADKRSIAIGGQGMGLAIVRMITRQREATAAFVEPEPGFSTTLEISWRSGT
jgi:signal transduction histidine kinase